MDTSKLITFDLYRHKYVNTVSSRADARAPLDYLLRYWEENKQKYLTKLFGDELILDKEITYEKSNAEMTKQAQLFKSQNIKFVELYTNKLREAFHYPESASLYNWPENYPADRYDRLRDLLDLLQIDTLLNNRITRLVNCDPSWTVDINGTIISLQLGMKTMKALAKVCRALNISEEFEEFRLGQSMLTNQKRITGTLHLSIHPTDFATASDNSNNWSSCMSWSNDGCYRLGTVEMMNSPMVLCAYISSNNTEMNIDDDHKWNSKKWRAWVIVHPQFIFVNRHYPYHNEKIAEIVLNWVKDLAKEKLGWEYTDIIQNFVEYWNEMSYNSPAWDNNIVISTNFMYNDIGGDDIIGCMSTTHIPEKDKNFEYEVNISGPAECMYCGKRIYWGDNADSDTLLCDECKPVEYCSYCGDELDEVNGMYVSPDDGSFLCPSCYVDFFTQCHHCGSIENRREMSIVIAPLNETRYYYRKSVFAVLCESCLRVYLRNKDIIPLSEAFKCTFDSEEMNDRWQQALYYGQSVGSYQTDDIYVLNPSPEASYNETDLRYMFGKEIVEDYCAESVHWDEVDNIGINEWRDSYKGSED